MMVKTFTEPISEYAVDLEQGGNRCVYAWAGPGVGIFYIGCGDYKRASDLYTRSDGFKDFNAHTKGVPYILASNVGDECVYDLETMCIQYAQMSGCKLINKAKLLSSRQLQLFQAGNFGYAIDDCDVAERY